MRFYTPLFTPLPLKTGWGGSYSPPTRCVGLSLCGTRPYPHAKIFSEFLGIDFSGSGTEYLLQIFFGENFFGNFGLLFKWV